MAVANPTLTDPGKFGLLIQCRMKMDKLNKNQLFDYANSTIKLLSIKQLKKFLFTGLNSMKNDTSYNQLFQMRLLINQIIEKEEAKLKKNKSKSKQETNISNKSTIPIIPKNASLSKVIPFDIISNNICPFLKMSSISKLAKCDRKFAIICHTPTSIKNFCHRYDLYEYRIRNTYDIYDLSKIMIDGYYPNMNKWIILNSHRFRNVEILSINIISLAYSNILNIFNKVKHLSLYDSSENNFISCSTEIQSIPFLETISFVNSWEFVHILTFLQKDGTNINNSENNIIYPQIKSITFLDCRFASMEEWKYGNIEAYKYYNNMVNFLLPLQPNKLEILKFEHCYFQKTTDDDGCIDANNEFENIDRIKMSLANLKGFVYAKAVDPPLPDAYVFFNLANKFLSNLSFFKKLESLHTHSLNNELLKLYLNNNTNIFNKILELCITISISQNNISFTNNLKRLFPNLQKLCLVINIKNNDGQHTSNFKKMVESILKKNINLKIFQIVAVIAHGDIRENDNQRCMPKINVLNALNKTFVELIRNLRNDYSYSRIKKQPLLFKYHIKLSHYNCETKCKLDYSGKLKPVFSDVIQDMILQYLLTYSVGKIQFKVSWNAYGHYRIGIAMRDSMKGLSDVFKINVKHGGYMNHLSENKTYCDNEMDFKQYGISATNKNIIDKGIEYEKKWKVDCRYCCNTPWV